jgi:hypothetical protein
VAQLEGVQPMVTIEDCVEAEELVKADPGIRALLKERYGVTDMALVACDPWYYGDRFGAPLPVFLFVLIDSTFLHCLQMHCLGVACRLISGNTFCTCTLACMLLY